MTIALDATYGIDREPSGVGLYSRELLTGLARAHPGERFLFYYRPHRFFRSLGAEHPANVGRRLLAEPLGPRFATLFHGLNQRLPHMKLRRAVATFHDLFVITGEYSSPEFRARFERQARDAAMRADLVIAVSAFTARQVVDLLGVEPARVRVVHHGVRRLDYPQLAREPVVLGVGAIQKRKNTSRLVEAFEALGPEWKLVLAGSFGYGSGRIAEQIEASPARDRIVVLGYTPPDVLAAWYARASIFAFPSLDEGFGMPVLEAMAAGAPVIASNRSAVPEVTGDAALLVDPYDTGALTQALLRASLDENLRLEMSQRGLERARLFTWDKAVRETWEIYRELTG